MTNTPDSDVVVEPSTEPAPPRADEHKPSTSNKWTIAIVTITALFLVMAGAVAIIVNSTKTLNADVTVSNCNIDPMTWGRQALATFDLGNKTDRYLGADVKVSMIQNGKVVDSYTGTWDRSPRQTGTVTMDNLKLQMTWSQTDAKPTCEANVVKTY